MRVDLLAGAAAPLRPVIAPVPTILVFDSGVGGLTVFAELLRARPDARFVYAADDAAFPYGRLGEHALVARIESVMERLIQRTAPDLVGSTRLAGIAEAELCGAPVADAEVTAEIEPCFIERDGRRTDVIVLGCTHYPLLLPRFKTVAPWPVTWIDPAPAIACRVVQLLGGPVPGHEDEGDEALALFTDGRGVTQELRRAMGERGLPSVDIEAMPLQG